MSEILKDNLKDYLTAYSDEEIEKIRESKTQLVTVQEFQSVHRSMLENQRKLVEHEAEKRVPSVFDILQITILIILLMFCFIYLFKDYIHIPLNID